MSQAAHSFAQLKDHSGADSKLVHPFTVKSVTCREVSIGQSDAIPLHLHEPSKSCSVVLTAESYECHVCSLQFEFGQDLLLHLQSHAYLGVEPPSQGPEDRGVRCQLCSFEVLSDEDAHGDRRQLLQQRLKEHVISVHFAASSSASSSQKNGVKNGLAPGEMPDDGSDKDCQITQELRVTQYCRLCFRMFDNEHQLSVHNRYHHSNRPSLAKRSSQTWHCKNCKESFDSEQDYQLHLKILCSSTFCCDLCPLKFNRIELLVKHVQVIHKKNIMLPKTSACADCGQLFHSDQDMRAHFAKFHHKKVRCVFCPDSFNAEQLISHMTDCHKAAASERGARCDHCDYCTDNILIFCEHYKKHLSS